MTSIDEMSETEALRAIAAQTSLGVKTVPTIIAHAERTDRGTQRRATVLRVDVERQPLVRLEARRKPATWSDGNWSI